MASPPEMPDDLVREFLLRLPDDDPACLLRASLACKRWRRLLGDPGFHRRHRELHRSPQVLGFIHLVFDDVTPYCSRFVRIDPDSGGPATRDLPPGWIVLDCRHGRALFAAEATGPGPLAEGTLYFVVWDPLTDLDIRLPRPSPPPIEHGRNFNAAVLCAADMEASCDHRGCHEQHFRVAFIWSLAIKGNGNYVYVTSARVYSSVTGSWSNPTSVESNVYVDFGPCPSALAGDALYFRGNNLKNAFEYQLTTQRVSVIEEPPPTMFLGNYSILLMSRQGGGLGFAAVEQEPKLCVSLWSREISPDGVAQWARTRVIEFEILLPDVALHHGLKASDCRVVGFAEGTDVLFFSVFSSGPPDIYMVELNSLRVKKVSEDFISDLFPYTSFCVPVTIAPAVDEETGEKSSA